MVTGGDSCSRGLGSNLSTGYLIDIFHICCKNCIICSKRPKINKKYPGDGMFLKAVILPQCNATKIVYSVGIRPESKNN